MFDAIREDVLAFAAGLAHLDFTFVPLSALQGDMVVERGERLTWWSGPTLLEALEGLDPRGSQMHLPARFPVQLVSRIGAHARPGHTPESRGATSAGSSRVCFRPATKWSCCPPEPARGYARSCRSALPWSRPLRAMQITLVLEDQLDVSRGDLIAGTAQPARVTQSLAARLCWLDAQPFAPQRRYWLRHTTRIVRARIGALDARVNVHSLEREALPSRSR